MKTLLFLILFTLSAWVCIANEMDDSIPVMEEVVVTATPIIEGSQVTRYGEKVNIVGSSQIDDLNAQDLPTALRRVPGITISRYNLIGGFGGSDGGGVFIRGYGSGRPGSDISMLVDGIPRFVGIWTHPLMDIMSVDYADRIEVNKSAQPVLRGNMSHASVNVKPVRMMDEGFAGRFEMAGGSHGTRIERLEHGGMAGDLDYYFTGSQRQSDGHRLDAGGQVRSLYGRAGYNIDDVWDASFQTIISRGSVHDPGMENAPFRPVIPLYDTGNEMYIASLSRKKAITEGSVKLYLEKGSIDWLQWDSGLNEQYNYQANYKNYGIRAKEAFAISAGTEIIAGLDHDIYGGMSQDKLLSGTRNYKNIYFSNTAPYLMISHEFSGTTTVVPSLGFRYNMSRYFGNQTSGQTGVTITRNSTQIYANAARAYNLPGVYAAVQYDTSWSGGGANVGNWKNLQPEKLDHYETGVSHIFNSNLQADVSIYYGNITNALRFVSPPPPPAHYANTGAYIVRGTEAAIQYKPLFNLDLFGGISLMSTTPEDVPNAPSFSASTGANYTLFGKLRISADAQYVSGQYYLNPRFPAVQNKLDPHYLLNSRFSWFVPYGGKMGEFFLAIENLTNSQYEYRPGYPMPGRTFMIGMDARI